MYRANQSMKTTVLQVLADILLAQHSGDLAMPMLLDQSAALDSVNHQPLPLRQLLQMSYGLIVVIKKLVCILSELSVAARLHIRGQFITIVSALRPTAGVGPWIDSIPALYRRSAANQTSPASSTCFRGRYPDLWVLSIISCRNLFERVSTCVDNECSWMRANWLLLNPMKTEVLWCSSPLR